MPALGSIFDMARDEPPQPSVYRSQEGTGFPSCSRALAKMPPNTNDPNGYYALIGVEPWADEPTIKRAIRTMMRRVHPDGSSPDRKLFDKLKDIMAVLLDPVRRANYNSIPEGRKLIDSEALEEIREMGIDQEAINVREFEQQSDKDVDKAKRPKERYWDYLAVNHDELDVINAQEWYAYLIRVAPMFRYEAAIRVLLHDGISTAFKKEGGIMLIPRKWEPSLALAFAMMRRHIGWPDVTKPRYDHRNREPYTPKFGWTGTGTNGGGGLLLSIPAAPVGGA